MSELPSARRAFVEPLEARIAPAGVLTATWKTPTFGAPIALFAGDGLSTGGANAERTSSTSRKAAPSSSSPT